MLRKTVVLAIVMCITPAAWTAADDPDPCPCPVLSHIWVATPCQTWNCAASALILANGDPNTLVLPTTDGEIKWIVAKRVVSGSVTVSADNPVVIEGFRNMVDGSVRFAALDHDSAPILVTASDGNVLVIHLKKSEGNKGRAVSH